MVTTRIRLTNDFHNTTANVVAKLDDKNRWILNPGQIAAACKKLCGFADCDCGGIRGRQVQESGDIATLEELDQDGTCEVDLRGDYLFA